MTDFSSPATLSISSSSLAGAKAAIDRLQCVSFESGNRADIAKTERDYVRLRRLRDETSNLLADIQDFQHLQEAMTTPPYFLIPHSTLFDAFIDTSDPSELAAQLPKFFFGIRDKRNDGLQTEVENIRFQIADIFKIWDEPNQISYHRNVLFKENGDDLRDLRTHIGQDNTATRKQVTQQLLRDANVVSRADVQKIESVIASLEAISHGLWSISNSEYISFRQDLTKLSGQIDARIALILNDALTKALKNADTIRRLKYVFDHGEFYWLNSCPDLPQVVRHFYVRRHNDREFRSLFRSLTGEIRDLINYYNSKAFGSQETQSMQVLRNAELLASIHVCNCALDATPLEGAALVRPQFYLVTNAHRISDMVNCFQAGEFRVAVRHPRLLISTLEPSSVFQLERPLSIMAATLDSFVKDAEGGSKVSLETIAGVRAELAETADGLVKNMLLFSRAIDRSEARVDSSSQARGRVRELFVPDRAGVQSRSILDDDKRLSLASLDVAAIDIVRRRRFSSGRGDEFRRELNDTPLCITPIIPPGRDYVAIPCSGHLRFALRFPSQHIIKRLRSELPTFGSEQENITITFGQFLGALDPPSTSPVPSPNDERLLANRLAFALDSLAFSNWEVARTICSSAIQSRKAQTVENSNDDAAEQYIVELLFVRQLASRAIAAQSPPTRAAAFRHMIEAQQDIDRMSKARPKDWRIKLARAAFAHEVIIFDATARRMDLRNPLLESIQVDQPTVMFRRLADLEAEVSAEYILKGPGQLYDCYTKFRVMEYFMLLHLIVWSGEADVSIGIQERASFFQPDWMKIFANFLSSMADLRNQLSAVLGAQRSGVIAFPMADFLATYGTFAVAESVEGSVAKAFEDSIARIEALNRSCEKLTMNGFARNLARAAKFRIISDQQKYFSKRIEGAFSKLMPLDFA